MSRGVLWSLVSSALLVALIALAGCSHYLLAEREPWRHDAEAACLSSGAVKESPQRVRISAINGPGACGIDFPLKVSALGESGPLGYSDDAPPSPPASIPGGSMPQHWPVAPSAPPASVQATPLPPPQAAPSPYGAPPQTYASPQQQTYSPAPQDQIFTPAPPPGYGTPPQTFVPLQQTYSAPPPVQPPYAQPHYGEAPVGEPMSIAPPAYPLSQQSDTDAAPAAPPPYGMGPVPPLGPERAPLVTASAGPVEVKPPATLACPIVSALDQWISAAVQPAAQHWFRQPVVEIKQISAYSCRGMNGDPNAHISEHAFGNALDIAEFTLADGHRISVQYGWHGTPEEQAFLHDVQSAACDEFTTVLAPGANVYHYNHIHVDLMRHYNSRHICEPAAISGEIAFERARAQYAARHGEPAVTGSIETKVRRHAYSSEDDDGLPEAVPGDD